MAVKGPVECEACGAVPEITATKTGWAIVCPEGHCAITEDTYEKALEIWNRLNENYSIDIERAR